MPTDEPDDDFYQLSDDDAVDEPTPLNDDGTYQLDQPLEPSTPPAKPPATPAPPKPAPPTADDGLTILPPRYCIACGEDLTFVDDGQCPRCERKFDPADESTTRSTPLPEEGNYWLQAPRLAGYALLVVFVIGRGMINFLDSASGDWALLFTAAMIAVALPWIAICQALLLWALSENINPKIGVCIAASMVLGILMTLGTNPLCIAVAILAAPFVGLLYAWRFD